jgi:glycosyltransferase involved in cell wall biosynthesis
VVLKISVVTVCYNSERTIRKTFDSISNQTNQDFEYVIIDGASSDNTLQLIKEFSESGRFEGELRYISEPDEGIYDAMNKGINIASGEYVALLNSDDWYESDVIDTLHKEISTNPGVDIFYGFIRLIKDSREYMVRRNSYDFIMEGSGLIQHPTCFIRKSAYKDVGYFDTNYRVCADQDLMIRMVKAGKKYKGIDSVITNFSMIGISYNYDVTREVLTFKLKHNIIGRSEYYGRLFLYGIKRIVKVFK